jgi:DNA-binding NtrC family response regulator
MSPLRIWVLEDDEARRQAIGHWLRQVEAVAVIDCAHWREVLAAEADLLLCGTAAGEQTTVDGLRQLAKRWPNTAVALVGKVPNLRELELLCQRLGLRYLGHFPQPGDDPRLAATVLQARHSLTDLGER